MAASRRPSSRAHILSRFEERATHWRVALPETEEGTLHRLKTRITANLKITVEHLTVLYEDTCTDPMAPLTLGITMESLYVGPPADETSTEPEPKNRQKNKKAVAKLEADPQSHPPIPGHRSSAANRPGELKKRQIRWTSLCVFVNSGGIDEVCKKTSSSNAQTADATHFRAGSNAGNTTRQATGDVSPASTPTASSQTRSSQRARVRFPRRNRESKEMPGAEVGGSPMASEGGESTSEAAHLAGDEVFEDPEAYEEWTGLQVKQLAILLKPVSGTLAVRTLPCHSFSCMITCVIHPVR